MPSPSSDIPRTISTQRSCESPGVNAGRGLKQTVDFSPVTARDESPGVNAGRGLKRGGRIVHPARL